VRGVLGHSRKIDLRTLLSLVDGQEVGALTAQAMDVFGVVARSVRQAIADLDWGGYIKRRQVGKQARASDTVVLTEKGRQALADDEVAADLVSLPQRHRIYRAALRENGHPDHVRAMLDKWRAEMDR
jgi:DNA-binding MarR family transcriptional regulator